MPLCLSTRLSIYPDLDKNLLESFTSENPLPNSPNSTINRGQKLLFQWHLTASCIQWPRWWWWCVNWIWIKASEEFGTKTTGRLNCARVSHRIEKIYINCKSPLAGHSPLSLVVGNVPHGPSSTIHNFTSGWLWWIHEWVWMAWRLAAVLQGDTLLFLCCRHPTSQPVQVLQNPIHSI